MTYINERVVKEAERLFGANIASFIADVATSDFDHFVRILEAIGVEHISMNGFHELNDENAGLSSGLSELINSNRYSCFTSILSNLILEARYPFLVPRFYSGELSDAHDTTMLDEMPVGWQARFGLELCEDIRSALLRAARDGREEKEFMEGYLVEQVKEKFGGLRWYDACIPERAYDDIANIICLYERLSMGTCCICGSFVEVLTDNGGYILPECFACREAADRRLSRSSNGAGTVDKWIDNHNLEDPFFCVPDDVYKKIFRLEVGRMTHKDKVIDGNVIIERFFNNGKATFNITELLKAKGYIITNLITVHDDAVNKLTDEHCDEDSIVAEYSSAVARYKNRWN